MSDKLIAVVAGNLRDSFRFERRREKGSGFHKWHLVRNGRSAAHASSFATIVKHAEGEGLKLPELFVRVRLHEKGEQTGWSYSIQSINSRGVTSSHPVPASQKKLFALWPDAMATGIARRNRMEEKKPKAEGDLFDTPAIRNFKAAMANVANSPVVRGQVEQLRQLASKAANPPPQVTVTPSILAVLDGSVATAVRKLCDDRGITTDDFLRVALKNYERPTRSRPLGLGAKFTFGKYSGEVVSTIVKLDPGYILWLAEQGRAFDEDVIRMAQEG